MGLPHYLAMTPEEFTSAEELPENLAWMSCRFSPDGTGLIQLPPALPSGSLLVLDDAIPPNGHDPAQVIRQLSPFLRDAGGVLLDFQKPNNPETAAMVKALVAALPCPIVVSEPYAAGLNCPVFLPPGPMHIPMDEYLAPYKGREIWLEAALCQEEIRVTKTGTEFSPMFPAKVMADGFYDETLYCNYQAQLDKNAVTFTLYDTRTSLEQKLIQAHSLGVKYTVGLWQELGMI